jgi:hypothetical protein
MTGDPRLVRALLACYPAAWRHRYGDEYAELLGDLNISHRPALIADSLRGAVRAYGGAFMSTRPPMTVTIWATGLFTVAGIGFQKLSEDLQGIAGGAYTIVVAAAAVALLALIIAAAPTAAVLLRGRNTRASRYVAVPALGTAVWYGALRIALVTSGHHGVHPAPNIGGFILITVVGVAVVAATAWAAATVLDRVPAAEPAGLRPTALLTVAAAMAVTAVAAVIWGLQIHAHNPAAFRADNGILATPFIPSWIATVVLMAIAAGLAANSGRRQLAADRATPTGRTTRTA